MTHFEGFGDILVLVTGVQKVLSQLQVDLLPRAAPRPPEIILFLLHGRRDAGDAALFPVPAVPQDPFPEASSRYF